MKLIFLDVDGVLNSERNVAAHKRYPHPFVPGAEGFNSHMDELDPLAINMVKRLCDETGASIIISSSWRLIIPRPQVWIAKLHEYFKWEDAPIIGITPTSSSGFRGGEINAFIGRWNDEHPEDKVEEFVILDDSSDFFPDQPLVRTDPTNGFLFYDFVRALHVLDRSNTYAAKHIEYAPKDRRFTPDGQVQTG